MYYEAHIDGEGSRFFESEKHMNEDEIIEHVKNNKMTAQWGAIDWAQQINKQEYNEGRLQ